MGEVENKAAKKAIARVQDYKQVFSSQAGRRVLHDMMKVHHMLSSTFVKGDPTLTGLYEGERNVVLRILSILKTEPQEYQQMLEEIQSNA